MKWLFVWCIKEQRTQKYFNRKAFNFVRPFKLNEASKHLAIGLGVREVLLVKIKVLFNNYSLWNQVCFVKTFESAPSATPNNPQTA